MTEIAVEVPFDVPLDRAYAYLADPLNRAEWQRSTRRVRLDDSVEPPALGTTWQEWTFVPGVAPRLEIIGFEPPHRWAEACQLLGMYAELELTLIETGPGDPGRCRVRARATVGGSGLWRMLARLVRPLAAREVRNDLRRAARALRTSPPR